MPAWRCPYCGTPQAESARCWVCLRSTTTCATCRHFRRSIATGLGLCGLDRKRGTLHGTEVRACWVGATGAAAEGLAGGDTRRIATSSAPADGVTRSSRTFVPVDELVARGEPVAAATGPVTPAEPAPDPGVWSLWGDAEA